MKKFYVIISFSIKILDPSNKILDANKSATFYRTILVLISYVFEIVSKKVEYLKYSIKLLAECHKSEPIL